MKKKFWIFSLLMCFIIPSLFLTACDLSTHTHSYDSIGYDESYHWNYCPQDNEIEEGSKETHYDKDSNGYCDKCNYQMREVHTHDFSQRDYDSYSHWYRCKYCTERDGSTIGSHIDENRDGKCDECGYGMELPEEESIYIEIGSNRQKFLDIRGEKPADAVSIKLHYKNSVTDNDYYLENLAVSKISYIFRLDLETLSAEDSPIYTFDIYVYASEASSTPSNIIPLTRKDFFEVDEYYEENDCYYTIVDIGEDGQLAIHVEEIPDYTITTLELKLVDNKPYLIIKAIGPKSLTGVRIRVENSSNYTYIDDECDKLDAFEFCIDLSEIEIGHSNKIWFSSLLYERGSYLNNLEGYSQRKAIYKNGLIDNSASVEHNSKRYSIYNSNSSDELCVIVENI